ILEPDQIKARGAQVLLAKLHDGPWTPAGPWVRESHRLHGPEPQCVAAAARNLLDRQACLKIGRVILRDMRIDALGLQQLVEKALVLLLVERAVEVIVGAGA